VNWRKLEAKRRKLESKYDRQWNYVFARQLSGYQKALDTNFLDAAYSPDKHLEKGVKEIYEKMIRETAKEFEGNFDELKKSISKSKWEQMIIDYLATVGAERITEIIKYTKKYVLKRLKPILQEGISNGDGIAVISRRIIRDIDEYKIGFSRYRADRIARTEIVGTSNWASYSSAKAAGISDQIKKKWSCIIDGRERETHREMNDKPAIGMNEFFEVRRPDGGVDLMEYPADPRGSAGNVINCRCAIIYERI
jgi:hypothetical protein